MSSWKLGFLAQKIRRGAVFAYPTDTIWGLGCHPLLAQSIVRIQQIKNRPDHKGLILLSASIDYLKPFVHPLAMDELHKALAQPCTSPITWVCQSNPRCPRHLTGNRHSLAVRITKHEPLSTLSHRLQSPLISTSANISGRHPVRSSLLARRQFDQQLDFIIEGFHCGTEQASQIRELHSGRIIRP